MNEGIYLRMLPYFLLGYAISGRSFAYLGIPPFYMGEILLLMGVAQLAQLHHFWKILLQPSAWLLLFFMVWSVTRTVPYAAEYGLLTLRDAALWGYGLFAFIIAMILIARPPLLLLLLKQYRFFARMFPFITLIGLISLTFFKRVMFDLSTFFQMKPGDIMVHLSAIATFAACGLLGGRLAPWTIALLGSVLVAGSVGRGGLIAFCLSFGFILLFRLRLARTWKWIAAFLVLLIVTSLLTFTMPANEGIVYTRSVSPEQLAKNIISVFEPAEEWGLEGTKRYRLEWWNKIINYTFFGDYFMGGKGYGINLAVADDQVLQGDALLRNPHNAHLTILARSGVPGLCLWLLLNIAWCWGMLRSLFHALSLKLIVWEGWFCTLLAFYIAALVNASFDVYLEGPMGGIWFWTVFGVGMASIHLYRTLPPLLMEHENIARS